MAARRNSQRFLLWFLLILCFLILAKFILFKRSPQYYKEYFSHQYRSYTIKEGWKHANFTPFKTIFLFYRSKRMKEEYKYDNLGGNIIGFIPIGILLPLLFISLRNFWKATFVLLVISLLFETTQLITGIGIFDIDDIILNTVGGMIGYLLCLFIIKFSRT